MQVLSLAASTCIIATVPFLRFAGTLALSFWIGGLAALGGVAASTTFDVLQAHDPATGRQLAGVLFGAMSQRFSHAAIAAGAVVLLSLGLRAALGPRPRRFGVRMWVAAAMVAGVIAGAFFISPRIETIRGSVSGPIASLPDSDPRKVAFGRWHVASTALMALTILAGIGLLWIELDDAH